MRVLSLIVLGIVIGRLSAFAQETPGNFQKDKIMTLRGNVPFVPLDQPKFVSASEASYLDDDEDVLGLFFEGEARAYPTRIMWFHHICNDVIGEKKKPILVVY